MLLDEALDMLRSLDLVESTYMTALGPNENGEIDYLLEVVLRDVEAIEYPDAVNILGLVDGMPSTLISDDGTGVDAVALDRIYSGIVPESCLAAGIPDERAGKGFKITMSCDWTFISPGDDCAGYGTCPETAHRSFLCGLIEYDTNVVTCWCRGECAFDVEFSF